MLYDVITEQVFFRKFPDTPEGAAMDGTRAESSDSVPVGLRGIALVTGKSVSGIAGVIIRHEPVPRNNFV